MKTKLLFLFLSCGFFFLNSCKDDTPLSCDLTATISASTLTPVIGSSMTFTIVAHNNGPDNASGVDVTNNLPTGYTFTSHTATAGTVGDRAWTIGNLASGKSETLTLVATVLPTGFYPFTVSILGAEPDNSTLNNSGLVTVVPKPAGN
jgi:large repetitive protein